MQDRVLDLGQVDDFLKTFSITDPPFGAAEDWKLETIDGQNTLFYKGRNYILDDLDLQWNILQMMHNHETAGHPGEAETLVSVEQHYWWPGLCTFVQNYVKGCSECQQYKINRSPSHPSYTPIPATTVTQPFAHCSMDLITDLPLSNGFDSILVVVDHRLMKGVILLPCNKTIIAKQVAELLSEHLYKRFRLPDKFISDRGPQFTAHVFRELLKLLVINSKLLTAYHPQTNGATEHVNQEIEAYLLIFYSSFPEDWQRSFTWWNSHIIIDNMQKENIPLLNLCMENSQKLCPLHLKKPSIPQLNNNTCMT